MKSYNKSVENEPAYKQLEFSVNGKRVNVLFPKANNESNIMKMIQNILISSYVDSTIKIEKEKNSFD